MDDPKQPIRSKQRQLVNSAVSNTVSVVGFVAALLSGFVSALLAGQFLLYKVVAVLARMVPEVVAGWLVYFHYMFAFLVGYTVFKLVGSIFKSLNERFSGNAER